MTQSPTPIHDTVREHYAERIKNSASCCGSDACCSTESSLYPVDLLTTVPSDVASTSYGCGDPITLASLKPGQTVLDLGSGAGLDCILAAQKVGDTGHVIGVDMTPEMIERAKANAKRVNLKNVEFRFGYLENLPVDSNTVDVIISNCVINLSANKDRVLKEAFRVLKPGGRFAVSDVVTRGEILPEIRKNVLLWVGCVAGALEQEEYRAKLTTAGFVNVDIEPTRIYRAEDAMSFLKDQGIDFDAIAPQVDGKFMSAFIRAQKPATDRSCCGPTCCA